MSPKRRRRSVENDEYGEFIRRILRAQGYSWTEIGDRLGITRQARPATMDRTVADLHAASMTVQLACN